VSSKNAFVFGNDTSSGIQLYKKNWIPDEALHQILKENLGKANSGMTGLWEL
jgi:hypothetical protein